jgi:hypothetical protein
MEPTWRAILREVLVAHQHRMDSSCICGWAELGLMHPNHVIEEFEKALTEEGIVL